MDEQTPQSERSMPSMLRALLLGSGLAAAAVAGSLFSAAPAQAAETRSANDGLLGGVGQLVDTTTGAVAQALDASPVTSITAPVLSTVDHTVTSTVAVVPVAGPIVTGVTGSTPTTTVVAPVTGLVDATLGATAQVVDGAGGVVDDLLPTVTLPTPQLPPIPEIVIGDDRDDVFGPVLVPSTENARSAAAQAFSATRTALGSPASGLESIEQAASGAAGIVGWPAAPTAPTPGLPGGFDSALPASSTGSSGGLKQFFAPASESPSSDLLAAPARLLSTIPDDDDLPSSAVADTDSSPD